MYGVALSDRAPLPLVFHKKKDSNLILLIITGVAISCLLRQDLSFINSRVILSQDLSTRRTSTSRSQHGGETRLWGGHSEPAAQAVPEWKQLTAGTMSSHSHTTEPRIPVIYEILVWPRGPDVTSQHHDKLDEPHKHNIKRKMPDTKEHLLDDSVYVKVEDRRDQVMEAEIWAAA